MERAIWVMVGVLYEIDQALHRALKRLLSKADELRRRRS